MHNNGIASHQKALSKDKRVVILTRSGFIGQQRYGCNTWSSDVTSTWDMLEKQIPAALNYTLMGIPNWNSDIGGFFAGRWNQEGGAKNPKYQELYVRWMQFGTFCPMMRSHGTELPREIWNFGKRGEWCFDAQEKMINLRYRLLPYIYSTSWDVSHNDGTFMRPLVMDFAADSKTHEVGGEFLFGRSLLVAPVTRPEVTEWSVYLPQGADWWDFWSNEKQQGGQTLNRCVSKEILPVYVKAGSILPFGPKVQYSAEKNWDNLEIRIYPGADGTFTLYEDENDNYNYEKELIPPSASIGTTSSSPDNRRAGRQFSGYAEKPQVQGCSGRSELRYGRPADERRKDNKLCRKEKKYKAVTVKRRNVSKLPYYFLGADYADFKNSICIVRVIPRNPRLILQHNEVVIYFIKKETATATQIPSPLP